MASHPGAEYRPPRTAAATDDDPGTVRTTATATPAPPPHHETAEAGAGTGSPTPGGAHPLRILIVLCVAQFLSALDVFIVNVALSPIGKGLHEPSLSDLSWILNGYAIVYAALLVPAGRLADRYGRRQGFILGLALFTTASLGAALSGNLWVLVAFRLLQAAGASVLTPSSLGLVLATAPTPKSHKYVQAWAASGSLAAAAGPVLGGLLVQESWRWIFAINLPIGALALVAAWRMLPDPRHDASTGVPDILGGVLLISAVGSLALGLVKAPDWGWGSAGVVTALAVAAAGTALFLARSATARTPIIDLHLFRSRAFSAANLASVTFYAGFGIVLLSLVLWMQDGFGLSAIDAGLLIAPGPCMVVVGLTIGERAVRRVPAHIVAATGALLLAVSCVLFAVSTTDGHLDYLGQILPGWLLAGVGVGLCLPRIIASATRELLPHQAATGSAVVTMSGQIGSVIGISLLVIFLASTGHGGVHHDFAAAWLLAAALMLLSALAALAISPRRGSRAAS